MRLAGAVNMFEFVSRCVTSNEKDYCAWAQAEWRCKFEIFGLLSHLLYLLQVVWDCRWGHNKCFNEVLIFFMTVIADQTQFFCGRLQAILTQPSKIIPHQKSYWCAHLHYAVIPHRLKVISLRQDSLIQRSPTVYNALRQTSRWRNNFLLYIRESPLANILRSYN